ncbi:hypothetical protein [Yoonia sp. 2307UL14-13]|uniref:hypothetical protein n=1 Tax=Yoonia sp. 2307UL14-13 TaxID=3126506 RepID=UPI003098B4F7
MTLLKYPRTRHIEGSRLQTGDLNDDKRIAELREALDKAAIASGNRADFVAKQTEDSDLAEGLYIKVEPVSAVTERYKYVRHDFLQAITASEGHWQDRPILPNQLADGVDIFAPVLGVKGAYDETA